MMVVSYNQTDPVFSFQGNWGSEPSPGYQGDHSYSNTLDDTYTVTFTGSKIEVFSYNAPNTGIIGFSVDGGPETLYDSYDPAAPQQVLQYTSPTLGPGTHTLVARVTGTKNPLSAATYIVADRVDVTRVLQDLSLEVEELAPRFEAVPFTSRWEVSV